MFWRRKKQQGAEEAPVLHIGRLEQPELLEEIVPKYGRECTLEFMPVGWGTLCLIDSNAVAISSSIGGTYAATVECEALRNTLAKYVGGIDLFISIDGQLLVREAA